MAPNGAKIRLLIGYYNLNLIWDRMTSSGTMKRAFSFSRKNIESLQNILKDYGK